MCPWLPPTGSQGTRPPARGLRGAEGAITVMPLPPWYR